LTDEAGTEREEKTGQEAKTNSTDTEKRDWGKTLLGGGNKVCGPTKKPKNEGAEKNSDHLKTKKKKRLDTRTGRLEHGKNISLGAHRHAKRQENSQLEAWNLSNSKQKIRLTQGQK